MSADEDTELRDLVAQTLEANGVLGKIRAQLRASVFLALEEQEKVKNKTPLLNVDLQKFLSTSEGRDVVSLVREFLQFFNLEYSLAVFDPEICCALDKLESNRTVLGRSLNVAETVESSKQPLLSSVVRQCKAGDARCASQHLAESNNNDNSSADEKSEIIAPRPINKSTALAGGKTNVEQTTAKKDVSEADSDDDFFEKKDKPWERKEEYTKPAASAASRPAVGNNSMSSLAGLPSLTAKVTATSDDAKDDGRAGKSKLIDLEYDDDEDKYDDDFQASNISPIGQTPRSARSDRNVRSLENDEIDEEIEEELSMADDLLKSEASANDDLTTDRTVSPAEHSAAADYVEDVLHP